MKIKKILSLILAICLMTGAMYISKNNLNSIAKTKTINPEGYYYKTTEKTHREINITKTDTGISYKLKYTKLSLPYDTKTNTSTVIDNLSGNALKISTNKYRHTLGSYSITFTFSKKNKIRYVKIKQKGSLTGVEGDYSFSATYTHFADEQAQGGPNTTVKAAKKPAQVKINHLTATTEKLYVYFKAIKKNCKGYQAQISASKSFKKKQSKFIEGKNNTGTEFVDLKPQKKYYVRIRAYNENSIGKKSYGKWSKVKSGKAV